MTDINPVVVRPHRSARWYVLAAAVLVLIGGDGYLAVRLNRAPTTAQVSANRARADGASEAAAASQRVADQARKEAANLATGLAITQARDQAKGIPAVVPPPAKVAASGVPQLTGTTGATGAASVVPGPVGPVGPAGPPPGCVFQPLACMGLPGHDGTPGVNGANGLSVKGDPGQSITGANGHDGINGVDGHDGTNGAPGSYPPSVFVLDPAHPGAYYLCPETSTTPAPGSGQYDPPTPNGGCTYIAAPPPTTTTTTVP